MKVITYLCIIFLIILSSSSTHVTCQDSCDSKLEHTNDPIPFDTSSLLCSPVWSAHNFILRYGKASSDVWSFVFSFPTNIKAYVAIGFSKDGSMVGSTAIVGWMPPSTGAGAVRVYYLGGKSPNQVISDKEEYLYIMNLSFFKPTTSHAYINFQLKTSQPSTNLLYAIGPDGVLPDYPAFSLAQHIDQISTKIDYSTGAISTISNLKLRRSHGILNIAGWSILMIIGSIIARYFKQLDPIWFYLHASIQTFGFLAGVIGIFCGFSLSKKLSADVTNHKNIAIFILVLGCLQVLAIVLRPGPLSKTRKYWNWYHHNVGRILIIFGVVNTFYGLHLGGEVSKWFLAYGVTIAILVIIAVILEIRMWIVARKEADQSRKTPSFPQSRS